MLLLDLNLPTPAPKAELRETEVFTDVNNFVATGFRPSYRAEGQSMHVVLEETRLGNMILRTDFKEVEGYYHRAKMSIYKYYSPNDMLQL